MHKRNSWVFRKAKNQFNVFAFSSSVRRLETDFKKSFDISNDYVYNRNKKPTGSTSKCSKHKNGRFDSPHRKSFEMLTHATVISKKTFIGRIKSFENTFAYESLTCFLSSYTCHSHSCNTSHNQF